MAWSAADIPAAEITAFAADKLLLTGKNKINTSDNIRWNTAGTATASDTSATGFPAYKGVDSILSSPTKPNATAAQWFFVMKPAAAIEFDSLMIAGHNLSTDVTSINLTIADSDDFLTNPDTIYTLSSFPDTKRIVSFDLQDTAATQARRFSAVTHIRLEINCSPNAAPQIGEIWLGRRLQLLYNPDRPFDEDGRESLIHEFIPIAGGPRNRFIRAADLFTDRVNIVSHTASEQAEIRLWRDDTNSGARSFLFCPNPTSEPERTYLTWTDPRFQFPETSPGKNELQLSVTEDAGLPYSAEP